jgi:hypothetical protein
VAQVRSMPFTAVGARLVPCAKGSEMSRLVFHAGPAGERRALFSITTNVKFSSRRGLPAGDYECQCAGISAVSIADCFWPNNFSML